MKRVDAQRTLWSTGTGTTGGIIIISHALQNILQQPLLVVKTANADQSGQPHYYYAQHDVFW
jgi:hypothetical protein